MNKERQVKMGGGFNIPKINTPDSIKTNFDDPAFRLDWIDSDKLKEIINGNGNWGASDGITMGEKNLHPNKKLLYQN